MSNEKNQVQKFYELIWNVHNKNAIPEILDNQVTFRGSLGETSVGHAGFAEYLDRVHEALADYRCEIQELVAEPPQVFAKMRFSGLHRGEFMGYPPTGKVISWAGAALFTFKQGKIFDLWVLGDVKSLEIELQNNKR